MEDKEKKSQEDMVKEAVEEAKKEAEASKDEAEEAKKEEASEEQEAGTEDRCTECTVHIKHLQYQQLLRRSYKRGAYIRWNLHRHSLLNPDLP